MGLLLTAPAVIALVIGYVWPSGRTVVWSLQERDPIGGTDNWVGFDNYSQIFDRFAGTLPFTLSLGLLPLFALLVVGPLLALAAHHAGRPIRRTIRVVLAALMVCYAPAAMAVAWRFSGPDFVIGVERWWAIGSSLFGLVCAVGTTLFLAVLRGRQPGGSAWPAGLVVAGLAAAATVAVALQAFVFPFVLRGGTSGQTPMLDAYQVGFRLFAFGQAAAFATLVLVPVMLLGVGAALLAILTGLRGEVVPAPAGPARPPAAAAAVLGLVVLLGIALAGLWPWLAGLGQLDTDHDVGGLVIEGPSAAGLVFRTWAPTAVSTVIGVGLAALAGFGIGGLRPLGRRSELLLLPFAPWLFVGVGPLFLAHWTAAEQEPIQRVDTFLGLIPPVWLAVPALFVFTLLFRGLAGRATEPTAGARYGRMLLRALPMLALVAAGTWLVQSQSLLWPLIVALSPGTYPAPVWVVVESERFLGLSGSALHGLVYPLPMIVIFAVGAVLLQLFYLDRLAIRVGRRS